MRQGYVSSTPTRIKPLHPKLVERAINYLIPNADKEDRKFLESYIQSRWMEIHAVAITAGLPSVRKKLQGSLLEKMGNREIIITNSRKLLFAHYFIHIPNEV